MNRKTFYDAIRTPLFGGVISNEQFLGMETLLDTFFSRPDCKGDLRWLAYMLATAYHETGRKMVSVEENLSYSYERLLSVWPSRFNPVSAHFAARNPKRTANIAYSGRMGNGSEKSGDGWKYRGRGPAQVTGKDNYKELGWLLHLDLVNNPDLLLELKHGMSALVVGMIYGVFTGQTLGNHFNERIEDPIGARSIINGSDRAKDVAGYYKVFLSALKEA